MVPFFIIINGLLVSYHVKFAAKNKETAGEAGAIQAIVDAMHRSIDIGSVQEDGCRALRNSTFQCGMDYHFLP